jgi:parallel beta-helix repeat protein
VNSSLTINSAILSGYPLQSQVSNNLVNGKPLIYLRGVTGGSVGTNSGQVIIVDSTLVQIKGLTISNTDIPFQGALSSNLTIIENDFSNNSQGVLLQSCNYCNFSENSVSNIDSTGIHVEGVGNYFVAINNTLSNNNIGLFLVDTNYGIIANNTIEDHSGVGMSISGFSSSYNTFTNNFIQNNKGGGIKLFEGLNNTFVSNYLNNNSNFGISVKSGSNTQIIKNIFSNNQGGISIENVPVLIRNNTLIDNIDFGILLSNSVQNVVVDNILIRNGLMVLGLVLSDFFQKDISNNLLNGQPIYYWQNITSSTIPTDAAQIFLINCSFINVQNVKLTYASGGVISVFSRNITVQDSLITHNSNYGLYFKDSLNVTFINNRIELNQGPGIYIDITDGQIIILNNSVTNNLGFGIEIVNDPDNVIIRQNVIANNIRDGLTVSDTLLYDVDSIIITYNRFQNNSGNGVTLINLKQQWIQFNEFIDHQAYGIHIYTPPTLQLLNIFGNRFINSSNYGVCLDGTYMTTVINSTIQNNTFISNGGGIYLKDVIDTWILNNTVVSSTNNAIYILNGQNILIHSNTLSNNTNHGVYIVGASSFTSITQNIIQYNYGNGLNLYPLTTGINSTLIEGNKISNNYGLDSLYKAEIYLQVSSSRSITNTIIRNNEISDNIQRGVFIYAQYSTSVVSNVTIEGNLFYNNEYGLALQGYSNSALINGQVLVTNNTFYNNTKYGMHCLYLENNANITQNTFSYNGWAGLYLYHTDNAFIFNNTISNNRDGLFLTRNLDVLIVNNMISNNSRYGIYSFATYSSVRVLYTTIANNSIFFNEYGIFLEDGEVRYTSILNNTIADQHLYGVYIVRSHYHTIKWNDFIHNNVEGVSQAYTISSSSTTFSENFWDDWTGPDVNLDNVVDLPYAIGGTGNLKDLLPRTLPNNPNLHFLLRFNLINPMGGSTYSGIVSIQWTSAHDTQNHSVTYSIFYSANSGDNWVLLSSGLSITNYNWSSMTVSDNESYLLKITASDGQDLSLDVITSTTFTIDNNAPFIELLTPLNNTMQLSGTTIDMNITDSIGLSQILYNWDNNYFNSTLSSPFDLSLPAGDGFHHLRVFAQDNSGNWTGTIFVFITDDFAPGITLTSPSNNSVLVTGSLIDINIIDANGLNQVLFNWDLATNSSLTSPYNVTLPMGDGLHILYIYAQDLSGKWSISAYTFITDDTAPVISLISPINGTMHISGTLINLSITDTNDLTQVLYNWDNKANSTLSNPYDLSLILGNSQHLLTIFVQDIAGNWVTQQFLFITNDDLPVIDLLSPSEGMIYFSGTTINLNITSGNELALVLYNWDGGTNSTLFSPYDVTLLTGDGQHTLYIYVQDNLGNWVTQSFIFITVDDRPQIWIYSPSNDTIHKSGTVINLIVTASNGLSQVFFNWDGQTNTTLPDPYDVNMPTGDGLHLLTVYCQDELGSWTYQSFVFMTDDTSPTIQLLSPSDGSTTPVDTTINLDITDTNSLSQVLYYWDESTNNTLTEPYNLNTLSGAGTHILYVFAQDIAGNWISASFTFITPNTISSTPTSTTSSETTLITSSSEPFISSSSSISERSSSSSAGLSPLSILIALFSIVSLRILMNYRRRRI